MECTLAARRRPEEAQSGACAPPQGRPTRAPPISRDPSRPLPTPHTLTRVGGPTGPRRWPSLHTAETTAMTTHVVSCLPHPSVHAFLPASWQGGGLEAPNHSVARQHKQLKSRLCCPCAGAWRQPERISQRQRFHSSRRRLWHGSELLYCWHIAQTPGGRQSEPHSIGTLHGLRVHSSVRTQQCGAAG